MTHTSQPVFLRINYVGMERGLVDWPLNDDWVERVVGCDAEAKIQQRVRGLDENILKDRNFRTIGSSAADGQSDTPCDHAALAPAPSLGRAD